MYMMVTETWDVYGFLGATWCHGRISLGFFDETMSTKDDTWSQWEISGILK